MERRRKIEKWIFAAYCLALLWLLLLRRIPAGSVQMRLNLQPLDTLRRFWWLLCHGKQGRQLAVALANLLGNVLVFVPMGVLLPELFEKLRRFSLFFAMVLTIVLAVELCQLVTGLGVCDVDDVLLNLLGALLGYLVWKAWKKPK